jgi:uncharacterized protein (DUF427 family)
MSGNPSPGFQRNPGKILTFQPYDGTVTVKAGGVVIGRSDRAKVVAEPPYPPVYYIPFADLRFDQLAPTEHSTHCPYKGDASYWTVVPAGEKGGNAMWGYRAPYDESSAIADHGAFYPDRVTIEVKPAAAG